MSNRKQIFFLTFAVFAVYLNSLPNDFIFDDVPLVQNSINVLNTGFWELLRSYRPLRYITYSIDYRIFGMNPWGFRLMNIIYHSLTVLSLFWMLKIFGLSKRAAFFSALIFAVHPVHTDSVAYISGRRDVLMGLFYVLSVGCFMKFYNATQPPNPLLSEGKKGEHAKGEDLNPLPTSPLTRGGVNQKLKYKPLAGFSLPCQGELSRVHRGTEGFVKGRAGEGFWVRGLGKGFFPLLLSLLFMFLSISSKEMGATIPLIFVLYIFYKDGSKLFAKRWFYPTVMSFLLLFSFFAFYAISSGGSGLASLSGFQFHGNSPEVHYLTAATIWLHYLKQIIFPFQLILDNANYPLVLDWNFKVFFSILSMFVYGWVVWRMATQPNNSPNQKPPPDLPLDKGRSNKAPCPVKGKGFGERVFPIPEKPTAFFLVFFVITLAPVLQIIPLHEIVALHYLYVPSIGFCAIVGMWSDRWLNLNPSVLRTAPLDKGAENQLKFKPLAGFSPCPVKGRAGEGFWVRGLGKGFDKPLSPSISLGTAPLDKGAENQLKCKPLAGFSPCPVKGRAGEGFLGKWLGERSSHFSLLTAALAALLFLSFSAQTVRRNFQLRDIWTALHADQEIRPLSFRGYFTLGAKYIEMKFPDKAWGYYQKAIDTGSWDGNLLGNIIGYYIVKGDHGRALNYYEKMMKKGEFITSNGVLNIAVIYMINGNCDKAVQLATSFQPFANQVKRVELVKNCKKHNFGQFDNNDIRDIYYKQKLMKELGLEIERKPYLRRLVAWNSGTVDSGTVDSGTVDSGTVNSEEEKSRITHHPTHPPTPSLVPKEGGQFQPLFSGKRGVVEDRGELESPFTIHEQLHLLRELAVVNLQSDIPEAIKYYKLEKDIRQKMGEPVPPIVEKSIKALEHYQHQVLVEGKYVKLDW